MVVLGAADIHVIKCLWWPLIQGTCISRVFAQVSLSGGQKLISMILISCKIAEWRSKKLRSAKHCQPINVGRTQYVYVEWGLLHGHYV